MTLHCPVQKRKAILLAGLYTSQALGLAFVTTAVPVILRQAGAGLDTISLIFVLGLCWSFKFLWAPLIDRYGSEKYGHYRGWLIALQLLMILAVIGAAFFSIADQMPVLSFFLVLITFFSATQDIAADGLSVTILKPAERAFGSTIQSAGNMFGFMLGGGVILLGYQWLGWKASMLILAAGMGVPLLSILTYTEPTAHSETKKEQASFAALFRFFKRPGILRWVPILLMFRINGQITYWLLNPFLVDLGWSIDKIGIALNIIGLVFGIAGAALGGTLVSYVGRKNTMLATMLVSILGTAGFISLCLGVGGSNAFTVYLVLFLIMLAFGLSSTVVYTVIMDKSDPASASTDFTLQWSLSGISAMVFGGVGMAMAEYVGYAGVLTASTVTAVCSIYLIWKYDDFELNSNQTQ